MTYITHSIDYCLSGWEVIVTEWETDGDDTSEPGVINRETLVERLAVVRHASARADTFVGHPVRGFAQRTFGGHLVAQAMLAAAETVETSDRVVNSLHCSFLRIGTHAHPLEYTVSRIRDGRSFSVREIAIRQDGRELARLSITFCTSAAHGTPSSSTVSLDVPAPDALEPLHRRRALGLPADGIKLPAREHWWTASRPVDIRYVDGTDDRTFWFRTAPAEDAPQNVHRAMLAFASDRSLLPVISHARGDLETAHLMRTASVDHALWFHADVTAGEWCLYVQDSPFHTARSGLARGSILGRDGELVATVMQQGLINDDGPTSTTRT
ncbi:thioesterase family protein [Rhodococcus corynebacterioides]|uniref:Thioesterase family protein n=1 Tax=Rhodococcoides corynebacterioides TaxID=53972 RepID=A0ABS7P2C4_9NOCA|nr:thioesterase family protein [Rhodococcus corynebacterioides]MBY6408222.1 thioesterase family protein [Rhodococcus corynebacterioides]